MPHIASMGIYVVKASVMKELLLDVYPSANDFGSEIIPGAVKEGKHVQAYLFEGYWEDIGTIGAFYSSQLALLQQDAEFSFYDTQAPIFSMSRFLPPSRVNVRPCHVGLWTAPTATPAVFVIVNDNSPWAMRWCVSAEGDAIRWAGQWG